jgi:hypothetical protein
MDNKYKQYAAKVDKFIDNDGELQTMAEIMGLSHGMSVRENDKARLYIVRSKRQVISNGVKFWIKGMIPAGKILKIHNTAVIGVGIGSIKVETYTGINVITPGQEITPIMRNSAGNPANMLSKIESNLEATLALGGAPVLGLNQQEQIIYLADPLAINPSKSATPAQTFLSIPRIIANTSEADLLVGFMYTLEGGANAAFDGYIEFDFCEMDIEV